MAFPTLYPTGQADFNTPRLRKVDLNEYAQHLMRFHDGRFGRHPVKGYNREVVLEYSGD